MSNFNTKVLASTDDARNLNGDSTFSATATTQHIGKFNTTDIYWNGFRWTGVTIPQGAIITSATVDLYSAQVTAGTTAKSRWYGNLVADATTFANVTADKPEGKTRTTAFVDKDFTCSLWSATQGYGIELVDVTTLIQEIVNQVTFASGNDIAIVCTNNGSANTNYIGHSTYDRDVARGAILDVNFTTASFIAKTNLPILQAVNRSRTY